MVTVTEYPIGHYGARFLTASPEEARLLDESLRPGMGADRE